VPNVKISQITIRMRGVSRADARRGLANLGPALQRALAAGSEPIVDRRSVEVRAQPRGTGTVADRIAKPLARALRGGTR
jgi:hypothetical protein